MLGRNRLSNHHRRTPDAKEIQEFPEKLFFYYPDSRAKGHLQMGSSLFEIGMRDTKIITTFQMGS